MLVSSRVTSRVKIITKEQQTRLQCLASAMPKPVMPSDQELWKAQSLQGAGSDS